MPILRVFLYELLLKQLIDFDEEKITKKNFTRN